ncbi:HlyD family secretion protein [Pseudomonas sp. UBA4194]|uniref:HlyD family secretion protein n=1 Tax=Pseudomonas sp. UBA4194 TaxID=1947317 RepID=UPI0025E7384B|nr:HlyD family secretion protein [Pseudomonas sp. UBA4194]
MSSQPPPPSSSGEHEQVWKPTRPGLLQLGAVGLIALVAITLVLYIWHFPPFDDDGPYTDNAYIRGYVTTLAPEVSGHLTDMYVKDYEVVHQGQLLAQIDPSSYAASVEQAEADLNSARSDLANNAQSQASAAATLAAREAALTTAAAEYQRTERDYARSEALVKEGGVSVQNRDTALAALRSAKGSVAQARANIRVASAAVRTQEVAAQGLAAKVQQAQARLDAAKIDLARTRIQAPSDGQLGRVESHAGRYVSAGTAVFSLVSPQRWIIADYKEAQTHDMATGQTAHFTVDALPGKDFHGQVERIAPATGSEFSAMTADNGTGNFVKVPQRLGVRIAIDKDQPLFDRLRPGMSVEITVHTQKGS